MNREEVTELTTADQGRRPNDSCLMTRDGGGGEAEGAMEAAQEAGFVFAREFVLPDAEDAPAAGAEGAGDEAVAGAVGGELVPCEAMSAIAAERFRW